MLHSFSNTGTIRIQGSQYDLYTTRHHVILKGLLEQVISFNTQTQSVNTQTQSAHSQSELLEEHDTDGNHSGVIPIVPLLYKTGKFNVGQSGFWVIRGHIN